MKSSSEITTIINESSTKLSSATNQVYKSLITNNNCHQLLMKSPSEITSIINESSTKLPSATDQVCKSKSPNLTLTNNNKVVISRTQKHIKVFSNEFSNEISIQSTNEMNTSIESTSMNSLNKDDSLVKNNP